MCLKIDFENRIDLSNFADFDCNKIVDCDYID